MSYIAKKKKGYLITVDYKEIHMIVAAMLKFLCDAKYYC